MSLFHQLNLLDKPDTSDSLALFARSRRKRADEPQDIKRPPRSQGPRRELAEAGREMPSLAQGPGSRGCRSQWQYTVGARGFDCGSEWEFDIVGGLQPQRNSSIQSLGSAPKMLAWPAPGSNVRSLRGLMAGLRIIVSTRAYATERSRWSTSVHASAKVQLTVVCRPILAGHPDESLAVGGGEVSLDITVQPGLCRLTSIISPDCHRSI